MSTDPATRKLLLAIARDVIAAAVCETPAPGVPAGIPILEEQRGVFVTLTHGGRLRGCIGRVEPRIPLAELLPLMAVASATQDPRFRAVTESELDLLHIEISLLSVPVLLTDASAIEIGRHGLMVSAHGRRGLLLPQVATDYGWNAEEFLAQTCRKAMLQEDAWKRDGATVHTFETEIIEEET
ncbi:MAG TPA: AmmeMemoRadiSam system protein A [Candidatus Krumholzibacteria bacterium]|nr:AmmeMemoRadiSam system protein A [Candidatus Krumholzibacteria bacterium]